LKRKHRGYGDTFYIDEVFAGVPDHSDQWRAALLMEGRLRDPVDPDVDALDLYLQAK
jgi:hypothetical protein